MDLEPIVTLSLLNPIETDTIISLLILLVLLATSALISGAEVAFFALKPTDLDEISRQNIKTYVPCGLSRRGTSNDFT